MLNQKDSFIKIVACQQFGWLKLRPLLLKCSKDMAKNIVMFSSQVKEAMQRIHDRGNIGKLILDVEKTPTPLVTTF